VSGASQLAAIRAVLARFDWERDDRQYALEEIDRIASQLPERIDGSVAATGVLPDGSAQLSAADLVTVLNALSDAQEYRSQTGDTFSVDHTIAYGALAYRLGDDR
jgi:hypothetical protein